MTGPTELDLMRLLRGELPPEEEQRLRARLLREPELAAAYRRLEQAWDTFELPPSSPVPPGFSTRVMAQVRQSGTGRLAWTAAPIWVRATAAAALVTGVVLGAGLGRLASLPAPVPAAAASAPDAAPVSVPSPVSPTTQTPAPPDVPSSQTPMAAPVVKTVETAEAVETTDDEDSLEIGDDLTESYWEAIADATGSGEAGDSAAAAAADGADDEALR